jgi:hypothetical protein
MADKYTEGKYEVEENILHLWYPRRVELTDESRLKVFFDEVLTDWIRPCPQRPYLLVNYAGVTIASNLASAYAGNIQRVKPLVVATFRYGVPPDFTGVAVAIGNLQLSAPANIFADEASARDAIRRAKQGLQGRR